MDLITLFVIAYLVGKGLEGGSKHVKEDHEKNKKKLSPKNDGDKSRKGTNLAAGILTAGTAVYTFGSGFKNGWKEALPEAREVVKKQREKNKTVKEGTTPPDGDGRAPLTEKDGAGVVKKDDPAAPAPDPTSGGGGAPTVPTPPPTPPGPAPAPGGGSAPASGGPGMVPPPPAYPPSNSGPAPAGPVPSTPGSSSVTTPGSIEVVSVDTLVVWLTDTVEFANRERDDATAAVKRISELEQKVENAYNAAAAAEYDPQTLTQLVALREQLAKLKLAREADAASSADAAANSNTAANNVLVRHGGINEAAAASPVEMAESTTYID